MVLPRPKSETERKRLRGTMQRVVACFLKMKREGKKEGWRGLKQRQKKPKKKEKEAPPNTIPHTPKKRREKEARGADRPIKARQQRQAKRTKKQTTMTSSWHICFVFIFPFCVFVIYNIAFEIAPRMLPSALSGK
jgi:hypothetical protein